MKYLKFNANYEIKVRLKDKGIEHYVKQHNEIMPFHLHTSFSQYKGKADEFGYHKFQFLYFLDIFGGLGMKGNQFFDIELIFDFNDFHPFEFKNLT